MNELVESWRHELSDTGELTLTIRARARAPKTQITDVLEDGSVKVQIAAEPVAGKANRELLSFIAKELRVPVGNVELLCGDSAKVKLVKIHDNV